MDPAVDQILAQREQLARPRQAVVSILAAALLHGGAVAFLVLLPRLMPPPPPLDYVAVQVVPAQRLGADHPNPRKAQPEPPKPAAPPPAAEEPPPKPEAPVLPRTAPPPKPPKLPKPEKPKPPVPDTRVDPTTKPKVVPPPRELLANKLATTAPPAAATPTPPAAAAGAPGATTGTPNGKAPVGSSIAALDNPDFTYDYYIAQVLSRIDQNWVRPPTGNGVHAVISFRIQSDGSITDLAVRQSSANETFDLAALRAVQNAAPFPPLPRAYTVAHSNLGVNLNVR